MLLEFTQPFDKQIRDLCSTKLCIYWVLTRGERVNRARGEERRGGGWGIPGCTLQLDFHSSPLTRFGTVWEERKGKGNGLVKYSKSFYGVCFFFFLCCVAGSFQNGREAAQGIVVAAAAAAARRAIEQWLSGFARFVGGSDKNAICRENSSRRFLETEGKEGSRIKVVPRGARFLGFIRVLNQSVFFFLNFFFVHFPAVAGIGVFDSPLLLSSFLL